MMVALRRLQPPKAERQYSYPVSIGEPDEKNLSLKIQNPRFEIYRRRKDL